MRADARANRDGIVEAALELFRAQGNFDVSLRSIAARANVGVATLHRHFPDRESLITTAVEQLHEATLAIVEERIARWDDNPEAAWKGAIHRLVATGIAPLASSGSEFAVAEGRVDAFLRQMRERDLRPVERLLKKAAAQGFAPGDLDPHRFVAGLVALSRPLPELTMKLLPDQCEWMIDVHIAGLRALADR
ncbi:hypothetical protein BAY61_18520 [Prauserella marina]|uniref:DNA-binding transcriptional regulator, AcrR family n=1 Tax=Prauserella marina TaxID=530584 RepID=A0A222VRV5_9PSEU|nr:TetR/AcrR family transcriptional regulator [Prauserella marina]ASR36666.1 hypothetical protein BAY61_18520 [Prauserella marina]PWV74088.1 TetR family transcriptional regulator [Prauserella marina]SDD62732.1 DNA-binding transcriptional regulator, AcrR family [Prauserella marina]